MPTGAITGYIDVAQLTLYAFWIFFAGLIIYLRREDKREGYPLESDRTARAPRVKVQGFPPIPRPKIFFLPEGGTQESPRRETPDGPGAAAPSEPWPGAPLKPTGDPMRDGVGPAAYAQRKDIPDTTLEGKPKILPLRVATDFAIAAGDKDPRGMEVRGADGNLAGHVRDVWVDGPELLIRYLEVDVAPAVTESKSDAAGRVLLPMTMARFTGTNIRGQRWIKVNSIHAHHFAYVPTLRNPDQVTRLEEDRITAYYASGHLYAEPKRQEPLL